MAVTREPEFGTVRMREGYDLDDVDDFVDVVIDALEGRGRGVTPEEIERYEFRVVRMKTSYVMEDVDRWLDAAAAELRSTQRAARANRQTQHAPPAQAQPQQHPQPTLQPQPQPEPVGAAAANGLGASDGPPTAYWPGPASAPAPAPVLPTPAPAPTLPAAAPLYAPLPQIPQEPVGYAPEPPAPAGFAPSHSAPPRSAPAQSTEWGAGFGDAGTAYDSPAPQAPVAGERTQPRGAALIHHVELWVRDFDSAVASFGWLFQRMGWRIGRVWEHGCAWTSSGGPYIVIESGPDLRWMPHDRRSPGMNHIAFEVPDRVTVDRIVADGPAHGWQLMFPDRHPYAGGPDHYAAYLENAEGFEVEVVAGE